MHSRKKRKEELKSIHTYTTNSQGCEEKIGRVTNIIMKEIFRQQYIHQYSIKLFIIHRTYHGGRILKFVSSGAACRG